jgi:hypothetical protein
MEIRGRTASVAKKLDWLFAGDLVAYCMWCVTVESPLGLSFSSREHFFDA